MSLLLPGGIDRPQFEASAWSKGAASKVVQVAAVLCCHESAKYSRHHFFLEGSHFPHLCELFSPLLSLYGQRFWDGTLRDPASSSVKFQQPGIIPSV